MRQYPDICVLVIDRQQLYGHEPGARFISRDSDVRAVLNPLKAFAEEFDVAVILVTHFRMGNGKAMKAGHSKKTLDRAKGELGIETFQDGKGKDRKWHWRLPDTEVPTY